ncbi:tandem-95 repeat protein [Stappia sp. GBMRC 2046]|uniref:Tandem-95 repeat protein n=1 Tax=Stappia sediminis TaxID=2692190 RepID=A0A7X3LYL7_9HYPH|nr:Ig-like domain-containing protein [Stappia sediminis]MXN67497.1 tandem-95 repeat protein [Stappia sediminis]
MATVIVEKAGALSHELELVEQETVLEIESGNKIEVADAEIVLSTTEGDDLFLVLSDGKTLKLDGFFAQDGDEPVEVSAGDRSFTASEDLRAELLANLPADDGRAVESTSSIGAQGVPASGYSRAPEVVNESRGVDPADLFPEDLPALEPLRTLARADFDRPATTPLIANALEGGDQGTNDAPVAVADTASTLEDAGAVTGNVLANDTDVDGDALQVSGGAGTVTGTYGTLTLNADGSYSYVADQAAAQALAEGETASDVFSYEVSDGNGGTDTAALTVTVTGTNDGPVAVADVASATEDAGAVTGNVLANDTDGDGDALSVVASGSFTGTYGTLTLNADGSYSYVADQAAAQALAEGQTATDTFTYEVADGNGGTDTATLTVTVTGTNDAPVAVADTAAALEDGGAVSGNVLANDTDVDGDALQVSGGAGTITGTYGTLTLNADGSYSYVTDQAAAQALAEGETASDVFSYDISDGNGGTDTATLTVTVTGTNDAPVAVADTAAALEDGGAVSGNVLANDTDGDGDALSVASGSFTGTYGTLTLNADGSYSYVADQAAAQALAEGETASDVFSYDISDGNGGTDTATLTVTVTGTNDAPVAVADTASTLEDAGAVTGNVLANDTDVDGDALSVASGSFTGTYGTLTLNADGSYSYVADQAAAQALAEGETASDVFSYDISDANGGTDTATLTVRVTGTNDVPVAVADTASALEDGGAATGNVLANDTDGDGDALQVSGGAGTVTGTYGTLTLNADGSYSYVADQAAAQALAEGETASDVFSYDISDGNGGTDTATLTVTVTGTSDGPVAVADTASALEDAGAVTGNVLANDTDVDGDALQVSGGAGTVTGTYGTLTLNADGSYSYVADQAAAQALAEGETASDVFSYEVADGNGGTDAATLTVTVTGTNDGPVAVADTAAALEDGGAVSGNVLANDTDGDGDALQVSGGAGTVTGTYGTLTLTLNADGSYSYVADQAAAQALAEGETASDVFSYEVADGNGGTDTAALTVTVTGTNDGPVAVADTASTLEDAGAVTGNVLANDTDVDGDALSVASGSFTGTYGTLTLNADGSYSYVADQAAAQALAEGETASDVFSYDIFDGNGGTDTATLTVTVTGANDAPSIVSPSAFTVAENTAPVGTVAARDADTGASLGYSITGGADAALFAIDPDTGALRFVSAPDFEAPGDAGGDNTYEVEVSASDGNGGVAVQTVRVTVGDVNEAPTALTLAGGTVRENSAAFTPVGTLGTADPDAGETFTYRLVDSAGGRFTLDGATLRVANGGSLDHEAAPSHDVTVEVTDSGGNTRQETFTISVEDLNERPTDITLSNVSVEENSADGTVIGTLGAIDPDAGETFTYTLLDDAGGRFQIDGDELRVADGGLLDFETAQSHQVTVQVRDSGGSTRQETFTIGVTDVNEATLPPADPGDIDGSNGFVFNGASGSDQSGHSVSSAGDINGDGFDDVIIGAPGNGAGQAHVVFGRADFSALGTINADSLGGIGFTINGAVAGDGAGISVSSAGDVNGDGIADLIIGANDANNAAGRSYVVFGGAGIGAGGTIELSALNGSNGFVLNGAAAGDESGISVSSAGDVNGDGIDDLIVGARLADPSGRTNGGQSYIVFGGGDIGASGSINASSLNGTTGFRLNGGSSERSGISVAAAGDINGDGIDDLIVGANFHGDPDRDGAAYIIFGGQNFSADFDLTAVNGSNGFRLDGFNLGRAGSSVSAAGDIDGDGIEDFIVGAPNGGDAAFDNNGHAYVVFGGQDFASIAGGDGAVDLALINAAGSSGQLRGFRIEGTANFDALGNSVAAAGDINGDGIGDLIIGADNRNGRAYVVFGGQAFASVIDADTIGGSGPNGFVLDGLQSGDRFGYSVSSAGDVNGDGFDDLVIGARSADPNGASSGQSYVIFGGDFTGGVTVGTSGADTLAGSSAADQLVGGLGNDTLVGDGGADVLSGGAGDDTLTIGDADFVRVDGGGGSDTLRLGAGFDLDLTAISNTRLDSIETIDLGSNGNRLTLNAEDVFDINGAAGNVLTVDGSSGNVSFAGLAADHPLAGGTWAASAQQPTAGYTAYEFMVDGEVRATVNVADGLTVDGLTSPVSAQVPAPVDLGDLDGSNGFVVIGQGGDEGGTSVSSAGDINGDGFDDLIIGAPGNDRAYIVFGTNEAVGTNGILNASALNGTNGFTLRGSERDTGLSVSSVGDINGDGIADLIVGAPGTFDSPGTSYVVYGGQAFGSEVVLSGLDGTNGFTLTGPGRSESGYSVSSAGDVNGDGIDDLIIGGNRADPSGRTDAGQSYIVFGGQNFGSGFSLASLDGSNGFIITGGDGERLGGSVSSAGDINGDGIDDLIVGAPRYGGLFNEHGAAYVVFGGQAHGGELDVQNLDGTNGFRLNGFSLARAGYSVSSAGDINGDGIADLVIGAARADDSPLSNNGQSFVVFGGQDFAALAADGDIDLQTLGQAGNSQGFRITGGSSGDLLGSSVSSAGDVNGDGIDDLIVGASGADSLTGSVYVLFGGQAFGNNIAADSIGNGGPDGFALDGLAPFGRAGTSVSSAGDVNGDGFDDLIVGGRGDGTADNYSGRSYVIFGGNFSGGVTIGTDGNDTLNGSAGANQLVGGLGNDTLVGAGGADVLSGGAGDDTLTISDGSFVRIDGGAGSDTLRFDAPIDLDLTAISNGRIDGIETVDLANDGGNSRLTLNIEDVFDLNDTAGNVLEVLGDTGDTVDFATLAGGHPNAGGVWSAGTDNGASTAYEYMMGGEVLATVTIDNDVNVTGVV